MTMFVNNYEKYYENFPTSLRKGGGSLSFLKSLFLILLTVTGFV